MASNFKLNQLKSDTKSCGFAALIEWMHSSIQLLHFYSFNARGSPFAFKEFAFVCICFAFLWMFLAAVVIKVRK